MNKIKMFLQISQYVTFDHYNDIIHDFLMYQYCHVYKGQYLMSDGSQASQEVRCLHVEVTVDREELLCRQSSKQLADSCLSTSGDATGTHLSIIIITAGAATFTDRSGPRCHGSCSERFY